jgi:hypothetical protein
MCCNQCSGLLVVFNLALCCNDNATVSVMFGVLLLLWEGRNEYSQFPIFGRGQHWPAAARISTIQPSFQVFSAYFHLEWGWTRSKRQTIRPIYQFVLPLRREIIALIALKRKYHRFGATTIGYTLSFVNKSCNHATNICNTRRCSTHPGISAQALKYISRAN